MSDDIQTTPTEGGKHPLGWDTCGQYGGVARHSGQPCQKPAGWSTEHLGKGTCKLHGGNLPNVVKHWNRVLAEEEMATNVRGMFDEIPEVDPRESLLACVRIAAAQVSYYAWRVQLLPADDLVSASIKDVATASGKVVQVVQGPSLTIWQNLLDEATAKLARYSKMALDAQIDERLVATAERIGDQLARLIKGILDDLLLTDEQVERAPEIVGRHLKIMEQSAA